MDFRCRVEIQFRMVWQCTLAGLVGLNDALIRQDRLLFTVTHLNSGAGRLTFCTVGLARIFSSQNVFQRTEGPLTLGFDLVHLKLAAGGTDQETDGRKRCAVCIMKEYGDHVAKERLQLQHMPKCAKSCSEARRLLQKKGVVSSIPALKDSDNKWALRA